METPQPGLRPMYLALLALILLLAFALRLYRLDGQSLWSDEGASAVMATRSPGEIIENAAADIHPPLYYFLLRGWSPLAGTGEFALRFPSLVLGVLTAALVYRLAARLFDAGVGIISSLVAAFSPLLVYYSQEARMYALMGFLATLSTYLFLRIVGILHGEETCDRGAAATSPLIPPLKGRESARSSRWFPFLSGKGPGVRSKDFWPLWLAYVAATATLLYTQYFSITVVVFQNVVFVLSYWRVHRVGARRTVPLLIWAISQAAVGLLFLPWFLKVSGQVGGWQTSVSPPGLGGMAQRALAYLSLGPSWEGAEPALPLFAALLMASLLWAALRGTRSVRLRNLAIVGFYVLLPVAAMYLISRQRPMFHHKFLMAAAPLYPVLLALGVMALAVLLARAFRADLRRAAALSVALAILAVLGLSSAGSLQAYYFDPRYARDDYRGLARYVEASSGPEDAIVLNAPGQIEIFDYYYRGALPRYPLPRQRPIDIPATESELGKIAAQRQNIWLVLWGAPESDPGRSIETWLNNHAYRTFSRWFGGVELVRYGAQASAAVGVVQPLDISFGEGIRLSGYQVEGDKPPSAGEVLRLALQWEASSVPGERYKVFTHILDRNNYIWGQHDAEPQGGARPTIDWRPGETIPDRHGLAVYPGTPPGEYRIEVGLYDAVSGKRLPVMDKGKVTGDSVLLGPVRILKPAQPPSPDRISYSKSADTAFGLLKLLGYTLSKVGADGARNAFAKGDIALLALHWQAMEKPDAAYRLKLEMRDEKGNPVFNWEGQPTEDNYPTNLWDKGEVVLDQHRLPLSLPPGQYDLFLGVSESEGRALSRPNPSGGKAPISGDFIRLERITIQ